jgi:hypothetical protein
MKCRFAIRNQTNREIQICDTGNDKIALATGPSVSLPFVIFSYPLHDFTNGNFLRRVYLGVTDFGKVPGTFQFAFNWER